MADNYKHGYPNQKSVGNQKSNFSHTPAPSLADQFNPGWLKTGIDRETVELSEKIGKVLADNELPPSQIRNIFGEVKRIQMKGFEKDKPAFFLLKAKMAYAAKRKEGIAMDLLKNVFNKAHEAVTDEKSYNNFVDFFESIIAFHKANSKKDN